MRKNWSVLIFCLFAVFLFLTDINAQYVDVTASTNVQHACINNAFMGGGVAFVDYNNDGWDDLVLTGGSTPDKLYKNNTDGTFTDESFKLNKHDETDINVSVATGDLNNDGCPDLLFSNFLKGGIDIIMKNDCEGNFELSPMPDANISSLGSTFFDFNGDGLLDIYSIGYVDEIMFIKNEEQQIIGFDHSCSVNKLYLNHGDFIFSDVTEELNASGQGCALATTIIPTKDGNSHGIYIANDFGDWIHPNEFLVLGDSGVFEDRATELRLDASMYGMGIAVGDYDNDLDLDLYITNLGENVLLRNDGSIYTQVQQQLGLDNTNTPDGKLTTGWGTFFLDADNDTNIDLFVSNGTVNSPDFIGGSFNDPNMLFLQNDSGVFFQPGEVAGIYNEGPNLNRGAAKGDLDNDGDEDIVISYINFSATTDFDKSYRLYRNDFESNNFLDVELEGTLDARDAYGSQILLHSGDEEYLQYHYSGGTHVSQNSKFIHFGLNELNIVDSLEVTWTNFDKEVFYNAPVNQKIKLIQGSGVVEVLGCMDLENEFYNPLATINSGCFKDGTVNTNDNNLDNLEIHYTQQSKNVKITSERKYDLDFYLVNTTGQIVDFQNISPKNHSVSANIELPIDLLPGVYFVVLILEEGNKVVERIVIL